MFGRPEADGGIPSKINQQLDGGLNIQGEVNPVFDSEDHSEVLKMRDINSRGDLEDVDFNLEPADTCSHSSQNVVCVRSANKFYGTKKDSTVVLDKLNMTVPTGIIYGLLGASGCGKTTLLNCILGLRTLNSGEVSVFGKVQDPKHRANFGMRVGYMPQEIALYGDFTIGETMTFFGWITGMDSDKIEERRKYLTQLLALPNLKQLVKTLSGGQQRRVSLATALLHEPELLILDEPTVGLDSVLRQNIWEHFLDITKEGGATVIITTHYIDEARWAHRIALMRKGKFLAEDSPIALLSQYGFGTLEDLFLKLSYSQDMPVTDIVADAEHRTRKEPLDTGCDQEYKVIQENRLSGRNSGCLAYSRNHIKALLWKNLLWTIRHALLMLATLVSPFTTVALFWSCIGSDPRSLPVAVVNYETNLTTACPDPLSCNSTQLGCYYLKYVMDKDIRLIPYDTEDGARESVLHGQTYASIIIHNNYSAALGKRVENWEGFNSQDIASSEINVFRDISNNYVANYLKRQLVDTFKDFLKDYMGSCDIEATFLNTPIRWETPIYGKKDSGFNEFVLAGILLLYICYLATYLTTSVTMIEKKENLLERLLVSGVSRLELISCHVFCQFLMVLVQSLFSLICLFLVFDVTMKGSIFLVGMLTVLAGCCGIFFGLCLSCACQSEQTAACMVVGTGFPLMVLSGILWPLEGSHILCRRLAMALPVTHAIESMRSIMFKGWDLTTSAVHVGFISLTAWTMFFVILSVVFIKYKKD